MDVPRPPPIPSYFVRLPRELQYELLDRPPYEELLILCDVPGFGRVCHDNTYWARRAGVKELPGGIGGYLSAKYGKALERLRADVDTTLRGQERPEHKRWTEFHDDIYFRLAIRGDDPEALRYFMEELGQTEPQRYNTFKRNLYELCRSRSVNILCWLARQGVWFGKCTIGCVQCTTLTEDLRALDCAAQIMAIDWTKLIASGLPLPLASLKYIIENKPVTKAAIKARVKIAKIVSQTEVEYLESVLKQN